MTRVYVGHIPYEARERDVERFFKGYGRIRDILMKRGYCFVELSDPRDADDAVYDLNGRSMMGMRVVVEIAKGKPRSGGRFTGRRRSASRSRSPRRRSRSDSRERRRRGRSNSRSRSPRKSRSVSPPARRSPSRSASPIDDRKDRSASPASLPRKDRRSASPPRNGNSHGDARNAFGSPRSRSPTPRSRSGSVSRD